MMYSTQKYLHLKGSASFQSFNCLSISRLLLLGILFKTMQASIFDETMLSPDPGVYIQTVDVSSDGNYFISFSDATLRVYDSAMNELRSWSYLSSLGGTIKSTHIYESSHMSAVVANTSNPSHPKIACMLNISDLTLADLKIFCVQTQYTLLEALPNYLTLISDVVLAQVTTNQILLSVNEATTYNGTSFGQSINLHQLSRFRTGLYPSEFELIFVKNSIELWQIITNGRNVTSESELFTTVASIQSIDYIHDFQHVIAKTTTGAVGCEDLDIANWDACSMNSSVYTDPFTGFYFYNGTSYGITSTNEKTLINGEQTIKATVTRNISTSFDYRVKLTQVGYFVYNDENLVGGLIDYAGNLIQPLPVSMPSSNSSNSTSGNSTLIIILNDTATNTTDNQQNSTQSQNQQNQCSLEILISSNKSNTSGTVCESVELPEWAQTFIAVQKSVNSLPAIRTVLKVLMPFFSFFDDYWFYQFHNRTYENFLLTQSFFEVMNVISQEKMIPEFLLKYQDDSPLMQTLKTNEKHLQYTPEKFKAVSTNGIYFLQMSEEMLMWNYPGVLIVFIFLRLSLEIFKRRECLADYKLFRIFLLYLRDISLYPMLIVSLIDSNLAHIVFASVLQLRLPFQLSFIDKINLVCSHIFLFGSIMMGFLFYQYVCSFSQDSEKGAYLEHMSTNLRGTTVYAILYSTKNCVNCFIHAYFTESYILQIGLLIALKVILIMVCIRYRKSFTSAVIVFFFIGYLMCGISLDSMLLVEYLGLFSQETVNLLIYCQLVTILGLISLVLLRTLAIIIFEVSGSLACHNTVAPEIDPEDGGQATKIEKIQKNQQSNKLRIEIVKQSEAPKFDKVAAMKLRSRLKVKMKQPPQQTLFVKETYSHRRHCTEQKPEDIEIQPRQQNTVQFQGSKFIESPAKIMRKKIKPVWRREPLKIEMQAQQSLD